MQTIAVVNQKGGVGKTSIALALAAGCAKRGKRVLVLDMDPQANATERLGVVDPEFTMTDVLHHGQAGGVAQAAVASTWAGVDAVAADTALSERGEDTSVGSEFRLREAMAGLSGYDVVLIDCPPNIGRLTFNALTAASAFLVVTEPSRSGMNAVEKVLESVATVRRYLNPDLSQLGIVVNGMKKKQTEDRLRWQEIVDAHGDDVWQPPMPERAVMAQAEGACRPVYEFGREAKEVTDLLDQYCDRVLNSALAVVQLPDSTVKVG